MDKTKETWIEEKEMIEADLRNGMISPASKGAINQRLEWLNNQINGQD